MAKHIGISVSSVQRIWRKHRIQPHKARLFKLSSDLHLAEKLLDIVGPHINSPAHALVLSIEETGLSRANRRSLGAVVSCSIAHAWLS